MRKLSMRTKVSTLALAIGLAAGPTPALAQSFNGTGNFVTNGAGANISTGSGTTDVTLNGGQTIIDWTPTPDGGASGTNIIFQAGGTTATFSSASDFAVLNRIQQGDLTRAIEMDGAINSLVNGVTGGAVYFYSPSGIVLGATSSINVGSLVLTASPLALDGSNNFISGTSVTFNAADSAAAKIVTMPGSTINALNQGSYVAMVAPRVEHHGSIAVNGSAALVGAEAATINFSPDGLFDIAVTTGTTDGNGVAVYGDITGPASDGSAADNQRVYLVAVPKNTALTMVIAAGSDLGFTLAGSASIDDKGAVVLGAGNDIDNGLLAGQSLAAGAAANISLNAAHVTSNLVGDATGFANLFSNSGEATPFDSNVDVHAIDHVWMTANGTGTIDIGGALNLSTDIGGTGASVTAGEVKLAAFDNAVVTIAGNVALSANATGQAAQGDGLDGGNATGGHVIAQTGGSGQIRLTGGNLALSSNGKGGDNIYSDAAAGDGTGGLAQILANGSSSSIDVAGNVTVNAEGQGGFNGECTVCNIAGGEGAGGQIDVNAAGSPGNSLMLRGDVTLSAAGFGGSGDAGGGNGVGGRATLGAADGGTTTVLGDAQVDASGTGGYGYAATGGTGTGGRAFISTFGTAGSLIDLAGDLFVSADGTGGLAGDPGGVGQGGTGTGGQAEVSAVLGAIHAHNNLSVSAQSIGGATVSNAQTNGGDGLAILSGPNLTEAGLFAFAGTLTVDGVTTVNASATGGDGSLGGDGGDAVAAGEGGTIGGGATIHAANSDSGQSVIQLGDVILLADAQGGRGSDGSGGVNGTDAGNGGSATAGKAVITAAAGSGHVTAGAVILSASATGGDGGDGGSGDGGTGGNGGNGGNATGGLINAGTESGNQNFAQAANNGTANYTTIVATANATGGNGGNGGFGAPGGIGGQGGAALGGNSVLLVRGSAVTVGDVTLDGSAFGGDGGLSPDVANGDGGDATAGVVGVVVTSRYLHNDQRGTLTAGNIVGTADATGGVGGVGNSQSLSLGGSTFEVTRSDATIASVSLTSSAVDGLDLAAPATFNNPIIIVDGTASITGGFTFSTPGTVSVYADDPTPNTPALTAASISISADNFIHDDDPSRPGPATVGVFSANTIDLSTGQDLVLDAHLISTASLDLVAPGLIEIRDATSGGDLTLQAGSTVDGGSMTAGGSVDATAPGSIGLNIVNAGTFVSIDTSGGGIGVNGINAIDGSVGLHAAGNITTGDIGAGTSIQALSDNGSLALGDLTALTTIRLDAIGDIDFGNVQADDFDFSAGGAVTGGNIIAGTKAGGDADGAVILGNINVGILLAGGPADDGFAAGVASGTSINVGNVVADEAIGFATFGDLTTGNLNAGTDVLTLVGGDTSIASITTPGTGRTYHGDAQMFIDAGGPDNFDPSLIFAQTPLRSGGGYAVTGAISTGRLQVGAASINTGAITAAISVELEAANNIATGNIAGGNFITLNAGNGSIGIGSANASAFQASSGTGFAAGAITAPVIGVTAGGTATAAGAWSGSNVVQIISNDIDLGTSGSIVSPSIFLISTNATQTVVGNGVTGGGYQLSDSEFDRLHGGSINVIADAGMGAAAKLLIGDLSVDGSDGQVIHDYEFITGNSQTESTQGSIRVVGSARFSNMGSTQSVGFSTGRFELDAADALLSLEQGPGVLGGELFLNADRVHVASAAILDQLAANPNYQGHEDDLNAPAAVQRPDGVIRAANIELFSNNPQAVLVQNTGTADNPAGFLTLADTPLLSGAEGQFGPIEMIINGQLVTDGGLLTGIDVRDFLIDQNNIGFFTANSMINGCALTGACVLTPIPPGSTPTPGIQDEVTLVGDNQPPPPPFGNEDSIDDNDDETDDSTTSPIVPPDPLFDTKEMSESATGTTNHEVGTPMRSAPGLTKAGDIDDPVSGSGNPGLMETPPPSTNQEKQP